MFHLTATTPTQDSPGFLEQFSKPGREDVMGPPSHPKSLSTAGNAPRHELH